VGITTRDRGEELRETLERLAPWAEQVDRVLIVDDGSSPPIGLALPPGHSPVVELARCDGSRGYIVRRNELVRRCGTPLYLSLDDDSHPVAGSIATAANELLESPELFALSFRYTEGPGRVEHWPGAGGGSGWTQAFVGCAHLLRVDRFLELGGYLEALVHQHEEREISLRAWKRGWRVRRSGALEIHHRRSPIGRDVRQGAYWNARNDLLVAFLHFPLAATLKKVAWYLRRATVVSAAERSGILRGIADGFRIMPRVIGSREPLPWREFNEYRRLPFA
jgi:GT2 family glycosyltransferase